MKIRNGFVSNSSSSSFVVIFDKQPQTQEELKEMMYPGSSDHDFVVEKDYYNSLTVKEIIDVVWKDIDEFVKLTKGNEKHLEDVIKREFERIYKGNDFISEYGSRDIINMINEYDNLMFNYDDDKRILWDLQRENPLIYELLYLHRYNYKCFNLAWNICNSEDSNKLIILHKNHPHEYIRDIVKYKLKNKTFKIDMDLINEYEKEIEQKDKMKFERLEKICDIISEECSKTFFKRNENKFIVKVNYADEDGQGAFEHGNIFRNVKHHQISHH